MLLTQEPWFTPFFSSFHQNVKLFGWVRRFLTNARLSKEKRNKSPFLSVTDLRNGERDLLYIIQRESFPVGTKKVSGIHVVIRDDGLLHVQSRLLYKKDTELFKWPIVLPAKHQLVDSLIAETHRACGHIGIQALVGRLREKFWILCSRNAVRRVIRQCRRCRRHESKPFDVDPAGLPERRVTLSQAFQTTGVDLAGPLFLKNKTKAWIVLYTCAVYRCVHLDFVLSLSTEAFLHSLERFVNQFGRPETVYSDNGSNFVGAVNLFKQLDWETIQKTKPAIEIKWIFNPPTAAWWGGWWERLVRTTKDLLKRMLGRARLDGEELRTCLTTVTAAINMRPLTTVTEDPDDLIPLTPSMFIRGPVATMFPEGRDPRAEHFQSDYRRTAVLQKELEGRFRKEYLSQLVQKAKERKTQLPTVGDVVLVGADGRKRIDWPMGRVIELIPGKDGKVRVVRVRTETGVLLRPLQRLFPLEISSPTDVPPVAVLLKSTPKNKIADTKVKIPGPAPLPPVVKTRYGRKVKRPDRP